MKYFYSFCRIFVGVLFIISGMIKANDPLGFSYKMEEYFTVFKLSDSVATKSMEMRELTAEEIAAFLDSTQQSAIIPTDYAGNPIDLSKPGVENEFMYTQYEKTTMSSEWRDHWFNDFCDFMHDQALALSIFMCLLEIILGAFLIAGYYVRITSVFLFLLILFFGFLTFYSAEYDKVTDCGCFGDALKLTPWQSFWKDAILGIFVLPILFDAFVTKKINGRIFDTTEKAVAALSVLLGFILSISVFNWYLPGVLILLIVLARIAVHYGLKSDFFKTVTFKLIVLGLSAWYTIYCYNHLPIKDYRPWAIGNNIPEKMIAEAEWADVYMVYKNKATGETKEYLAVKNSDGKPVNDFSWMTEKFTEENEFVEQRKQVNKPFEEAPIHDFTLDDPNSGSPYAETFIFNSGYKFMLVAYDISKTNTAVQPQVNAFAQACQQAGIEFIGATSSGDKIEDFRHTNQNAFPYYINDATSLKTIIRSNPGLVMLKDTTIVGKWHYNDFPTFEDVKTKLMN